MITSAVKSTFQILGDTFKILIKYPVLFLPVLISWVFYGAIIIYFKYYFNWETITTTAMGFGLAFLIIFVFCFIFSVSSFVMLEIIQQIETKSKISMFKALDEVIRKDLLKAFPIMLVWAIIWFVIEVLELLFKRKDSDDGYNERTYENMAKTLSGYESFSLWGLTFNLIKSGVRLIVFFIYPSIAWEDEGPINAVKKGFSGIKNNAAEFVTGFFSIEAVATLIFLPPGIMFWLSDDMNIKFRHNVALGNHLYSVCFKFVFIFAANVCSSPLYVEYEMESCGSEGYEGRNAGSKYT